MLKKCEEKKLEYISITDHNTCKQYEDEALSKGIFTGKIIKGAEMNATLDNGKKIEFLAYNIKNTEILKVICVGRKGDFMMPCGACMEYMMQLSDNSENIEILKDLNTKEFVKLKELIPTWWGKER